MSSSIIKMNILFYRGELALEAHLWVWDNFWQRKWSLIAFYFILKACFVFNIFKFLSWLFISERNCLIRKLKSISRFLTSQTDKQIITIHLLPNILRSKDNQAFKLGQAIKYKVRNIFSTPLFVFLKSFI